MYTKTQDQFERLQTLMTKATNACDDVQIALREIGDIATPVDESDRRSFELLQGNLRCMHMLLAVLRLEARNGEPEETDVGVAHENSTVRLQ